MMVEQRFIEWAMSIGVDRRIAELIHDCDRAIAAYPEAADPQWLWRIEGQKSRLLSPDLPLIVALVTSLCEETPALASTGAAAIKALTLRHPSLQPFQARLLAAEQDQAPRAAKHDP
jgi:hypothetical protein